MGTLMFGDRRQKEGIIIPPPDGGGKLSLCIAQWETQFPLNNEL